MSKNFELLREAGKQELVVSTGAGEVVPPFLAKPTNHREIARLKATQENAVDVSVAMRHLKKNWHWGAGFALAMIVLVGLYTFLSKPVFEPQARLEVDPPGSESFSLANVQAVQDTTAFLETQAEILKGDELGVRVVRTLHLDSNPEFVSDDLKLKKPNIDPGKLPADAVMLTPAESAALSAFHKRLWVNTFRSNRIVEIGFGSHDPVLAAQIVNTLTDQFINRDYQTRYEAIMNASTWLTRQLDDIRQKLDSSQAALAKYQKETGIIDVDEKQNTVNQRVSELNKQLTDAEGLRIQLQAAVDSLNKSGASSEVETNPLVESLSERLAEARADLAQAKVSYGNNNANVKRLANSVTELESELTAARSRLAKGIASDYGSASTRERMLKSSLDATNTLNDKMMKFMTLKREMQNNQDLYNSLYARVKEAGIAAASRSSNIRIIDRAQILNRPTRPRKALNMILAVLAGLIGGVFVCFLKEGLDTRVRSAQDVKELTGLRCITMVPMVEIDERLPEGASNGNGLMSKRFQLDRPLSPEAEAIRLLQAELQTLDSHKHALLITSPRPQEGKTTLAVNLAIAQAHHFRTCLVDADVRKPGVAAFFGLSAPTHDLTAVLRGETPLESALIRVEGVANLTLLPAASPTPEASHLIMSNKMSALLQRLRASFECVIIDSAPFLACAEARALTNMVDGVILIGRSGATTKEELVQGAEVLTGAGAPIVGVVLNSVDMEASEYRYFRY